MNENTALLWSNIDPEIVSWIEEAFPEIMRALQKLAIDRDWIDLEGIARSAQRTALHQLKDGQSTSITAQTRDQLTKWLVTTARRKLYNQLRHYNVEQNNAQQVWKSKVAGASWLLGLLPPEEVVDLCAKHLKDNDLLRYLFLMLQGYNTTEIALDLKVSSSTVKRKFKAIAIRLRQAEEDIEEDMKSMSPELFRQILADPDLK